MHVFTALPTRIAGLQAVSGTSDHAFPRHTHDDFGIGIVVKGANSSASGRGQVEAGPGNVITVNPGEVHDGIPIGGLVRTWHMFYLSTELVDEIAEGLDVAPARSLEFHHPVIADGIAASRFSSAWQTLAHRPGANAGAMADEEGLLTCLEGLLGPRRDIPLSPLCNTRIARLKAMIDDDPLADHSLQRLAREAGLSRFQTLRAFARATGLTPHAYLLDKRVQAARRMILSGADLADTAAASGFADQSHLTREFRKRYGLTPASARKAAAIPFKTQTPSVR